MDKKIYAKPELKTRKIELGVFGDYGNDVPRRNIRTRPSPVDVIGKLDLHME
jgi:hypothetical protein